MNKIDEMLASFAQEDFEKTVGEEESLNAEDNKEYVLEIVNSRFFQAKLREVLVDLLDFSSRKMYEVTGKDLGIDHEKYLSKEYPKPAEFDYSEPDQDYKFDSNEDKRRFVEALKNKNRALTNLKEFKDKLNKGFIPNSQKSQTTLSELMDKLDQENEELERLKLLIGEDSNDNTNVTPIIDNPFKKAYILNNFIKAANIVSYDRMADAIFSYGRNNLIWDINSFLVKELSDFKFNNLGDAISFIKKISKEDLKKHLTKSVYKMAEQVASSIMFASNVDSLRKFKLDFMNLALNKIHNMLTVLFR